MSDTYRIKQSGEVVATSEGQHGLRDIMAHARFYAQDGPLIIQRHNGRRWGTYGVMND